MNQRLRNVWIPGFFFVAILGLALMLAGAVLVVPWFADETPAHPLIALYAHDLTVRRISLASAAGLMVTAFVFFRPVGWLRKREPKSDGPTNIAGA
jgi:hypothetical protein